MLIVEEPGGEEQGNDIVVVAPPNFSVVEHNIIYRSGFPQPSNFPFFATLNLRSIIYLCPEQYPEENLEFLRTHEIKLFQFGIDGTKEPSVTIPSSIITEALKVLIDVRNHPVLIHCRRGKNWCLNSVLEEYRHFVGSKSRETDFIFLEEYDVSCLRHCLYSIIYQYQGYGLKKKLLPYSEERIPKPLITAKFWN